MRSLLAGITMILTVTASLGAQIPAGVVTSAELWFDAKASLGPFRGVTRVARGALAGGTSLATTRGYVEMQATSLSTDNGIRDRDMRKTLDVEKFPVIRYDLDSMHVVSDAGDSATVELIGRMTIHGVTRPLRIPSTIRHHGRTWRVTGTYDLILPDYGVTRLKRMLGALSMNEQIHVGLDVTFSAAPEGAPE